MIKIIAIALLLMASTLAYAQDPCSQRWVTQECLETYDFNGTDGTDGIDGVDGINGFNGFNGTDGADGTNGVNGADGINGFNGADGVDGINGADGANGIDGYNGIDGVDGLNGYNGIDGADGADGIDGVNGTDGARGMRGLRGLTGRASDDFYAYLAATNAARVYLPQIQKSRITFGMSRVHGKNGLGVGYALLLDDGEDNTAVTFSLGLSDRKVAFAATFGFEF